MHYLAARARGGAGLISTPQNTVWPSSTAAGYVGHIPPMYFPPGCFVYLAAGVKEVVNLPVRCHGWINDPVQVDTILADNQADLIGMARALIRDPEWPNKVREGMSGLKNERADKAERGNLK
jgi:2,4-dienoyl-CoA reductase-like NADH-dependent reductase (Old Yellow Enzyme family)